MADRHTIDYCVFYALIPKGIGAFCVLSESIHTGFAVGRMGCGSRKRSFR